MLTIDSTTIPTSYQPAMHDSRTSDRTSLQYTMKTPATRHSPAAGSSHPHPHSHSHSHSTSHSHPNSNPYSQSFSTHMQSLRSNVKQQTKVSTPIASPRPQQPLPAGQNQAPNLSPARGNIDRAPSPNYFGLILDTSGNEPRDSSGPARDNWSPSSSIKSFQAALPKHVSLESNSDFEAFKQQADLNRSNAFALSAAHYAPAPTLDLAMARPRPTRWNTHSSEMAIDARFSQPVNSFKDRSGSRMQVDHTSPQDSAYVSSESKRNSESSLLPPMSITGQPRHESPQAMDPSQQRTSLTRAEDRDPRLSMMEHKVDPPSPSRRGKNRAATVPVKLEGGQPSMISGDQLRDIMQDKEYVLLLDIRSSQNFAMSRIKGALNLCIPTTLLKRATFKIQKLQLTFRSGPDNDRFAKWKEMKSIVVYDAHSSERGDAVTAQNMIKKFTNEGFQGGTSILSGGFNKFQQTHPELVDKRTTAEIMGKTNGGPRGNNGIAPVIGGVMLPTGNNFNPFFSNIRQNMDLADGVSQFDISRPQALDSPDLPKWLREAAARPDHGKKVADKFLNIEVQEQSRMREAYSAFDPSKGKRSQVQLCGVEKGVKNRYKDILPFEHARVRLQEKPQGSCDYINASYLKASRSNKRYIATQGPLPATFEDFWSVVWEQDARVIVMLTAESEGGQLKCHTYWKERDFGPIRLKPLSEKKVSLDIDNRKSDSHATSSSQFASDQSRRRASTTATTEFSAATPQPASNSSEPPFVVIRKFALSHASHPFAPIREITHLHFPSWPDFGTPAQPSHLLALVELANVMQRAALPVSTGQIMDSMKGLADHPAIAWYDEPEEDAQARPMLVHCSAGCGRTGTFCAVDSVIDMLKRQRQAKHAMDRNNDAEGDTTMADAESVSPTNKQFSFFDARPRQQSTVSRPFQATNPDLSWIHDDAVDLVQKAVEDFRGQRLSMVQSLRQFVLCYETVLEWVSRMNEKTANAPSGRGRSESLQQPASRY